MGPRDQARLDPLEQASIRRVAVGQPDQADDVAERRRLGDVGRADASDAGDLHRFEIDPAAERDRGEDRQLVRGVDAFDVESRIGLGVAKRAAAP